MKKSLRPAAVKKESQSKSQTKGIKNQKTKSAASKNKIGNKMEKKSNTRRKINNEKIKIMAGKKSKTNGSVKTNLEKSVKNKQPKISLSKAAIKNPSRTSKFKKQKEKVNLECEKFGNDYYRKKRNKEIVVSNVPYPKNNDCKESQIGTKENCFGKNNANVLVKTKEKTAQYINELKDLLGRLIVKVKSIYLILSLTNYI